MQKNCSFKSKSPYRSFHLGLGSSNPGESGSDGNPNCDDGDKSMLGESRGMCPNASGEAGASKKVEFIGGSASAEAGNELPRHLM